MSTADRHLPATGAATPYNNHDWLRLVNRTPASARSNRGATVPMDIDSTGNRYLGPKPMQIDSTGSQYLGAKPMQGVAYQCRKCRRQFDHKDDLSRHYNRHPTHR